MIKVNIKNFQSIGNAEFVVDGFTAIIGKNNLGKSAVIRAIDAALSNQAGKEYIRHGTKSTEVTLETKDLKIDWKKGDKSTYTVNGESFTSLNRSVPKPILDAGFRKIEIGDLKIGPLVAHQFEPLFIIDEPGSVATEVLSSVYNMDIYSTADDLCQKELRSIKSLTKTREVDKKSIEADLEKYKDFDILKDSVKALHSKDQACKALQTEIADLTRMALELEKLSKSVKSLQAILAITIPSSSTQAGLIDDLQWVQTQILAVNNLNKSVTSLEKIQIVTIPSIPDIRPKIDELTAIGTYGINLKNSAISLKEIQAIHDVLNSSVPALLSNLEQFRQTSETVGIINNLDKDFRPLVDSVKNGKIQLDQLNGELNPLLDEYNKITICPFCGKPKS